MSSKKGFVIFSILILIQMVMMISTLFIFEYASLMKQATQFYQNEWEYVIARKYLLNIAADLSEQLNHCLIKLPAQQSLQDLPKQWWRDHGCSYWDHDQEYRYVIEYLGQDACGFIGAQDDRVADYYRITLNVMNPVYERSSLLLQQVYTIAIPKMLECQSKKHLVELGLQSEQILSMD